MNVTIEIYHERAETLKPDVVEEMEVWDDYWGTNHSPPFGNVDEEDQGDVWIQNAEIHNHNFYRIDVETDEPVILNIHTNDSPHSKDWSKPIERGLRFDSDSRPFSCEIWGEVLMWVERDE